MKKTIMRMVNRRSDEKREEIVGRNEESIGVRR